MGTMNQSGQWSSLGTHGSLVVMWWLCISGCGETWKFRFFKLNWTLKVKVNHPPKPTGILTKVFCTSGPTLVILAGIGDELWCGQSQNGVNLDFWVKLDLDGQGRLLHKTIKTLTNVFCSFDPNLVIVAWTGPELSRGQASDWHTDWQTHRRRQRQYPKAKTNLR